MVTNALIGHTGLIGSVVSDNIAFESCYNSTNIEQLAKSSFDTIYCAAPSGNRLLANQQPQWDSNNLAILVDNLKQIACKRFVLISTVDTVHAPESTYGRNRLELERFVQNQFDICHIIRLCTLIHPRISKNILFDIKNKKYLDSINGSVVRQYYPLSRLSYDIATILTHDIKEINLVSEPLSDQQIVDVFCPHVRTVDKPVAPYNLYSRHPFGRYVLSKQEIIAHIQDYMND